MCHFCSNNDLFISGVIGLKIWGDGVIWGDIFWGDFGVNHPTRDSPACGSFLDCSGDWTCLRYSKSNNNSDGRRSKKVGNLLKNSENGEEL